MICVRSVIILAGFFRLFKGAGVPRGMARESGIEHSFINKKMFFCHNICQGIHLTYVYI